MSRWVAWHTLYNNDYLCFLEMGPRRGHEAFGVL